MVESESKTDILVSKYFPKLKKKINGVAESLDENAQCQNGDLGSEVPTPKTQSDETEKCNCEEKAGHGESIQEVKRLLTKSSRREQGP